MFTRLNLAEFAIQPIRKLKRTRAPAVMQYRYKDFFSVCAVQVIAFPVLLATCGLLTCLAFAVALAHLTIIFGRRLFGRKGL